MKKPLILINILFFLFFFSFTISAEEPFKCTSHFKSLTEKDNDHMLFDGKLTLFLKNDTEGFFAFSGTVSTKDHHYLLSRVSYFTFAPQEINQVKRAKVINVIKRPIDTLPENIWQADLMPERAGVDFYIEIWPLKDNLLLVKSLNSGYLICAQNE
ncbi:hypothetical protein QK324_07375 [Serratia ureilytica]|uniref:hypothetical protein n=1 Tax=Serratia ureilytica TaxID=300181 RepID=UPI00249AB154|nr:hypothetical protein [Serratia ureilytica]MDI3197836.1 hypothetical protein [Serratia ureilytica]